MAFGYHITLNIDTDDRRMKYIKLPNACVQSNGYKPQPLDLTHAVVSATLNQLIEILAENAHNLWAAERIKDGYTYGLSAMRKRSPHLLPYSMVDESIKTLNRHVASETVRTLLVYGYSIEATADELDRDHDAMPVREPMADYRTYRAEQTFAVSQGKWYYEVQILTAGRMHIGWARASQFDAFDPLGTDAGGFALDGSNARRCHSNVVDGFGKPWAKNDIVGCMIDLHDRTMSFSLNGELMLDNFGSETAFDEFDADDVGFVPAMTLFKGEKVRVNFGQEVHTLKYFTSCGLQEGYEPFCV